MSNNPLPYIKISLSQSLNISTYELHAHNIDAIFEIFAITCSCVFNEYKIFNHLLSYATSVEILMFYGNGNHNKRGKYAMGQKNCIDSQNELIIFVKSQNLTNTFKPFLLILLRPLFKGRFKTLHCYGMSNNTLTHIKVSLSFL